jgi:hypothetical protein
LSFGITTTSSPARLPAPPPKARVAWLALHTAFQQERPSQTPSTPLLVVPYPPPTPSQSTTRGTLRERFLLVCSPGPTDTISCSGQQHNAPSLLTSTTHESPSTLRVSPSQTITSGLVSPDAMRSLLSLHD